MVSGRLRRLGRTLGDDIERIRIDTSATKAEVARVAGIGRTFYGRIEAGTMPCDGAWPAERVAVFRQWIDAGKPA